MFKTDKKSLEDLSFIFNEQDIARLDSLLSLMKSRSLSTLAPEELSRLEHGLREIGKLKLEGKVYAFHIEDEWAYKQGLNAGYGVELHKRQGDRLADLYGRFDRDWVIKVEEASKYLNKERIKTIYTGYFPPHSTFLNLPQTTDPEDPIDRSCLKDEDIDGFKSRGIEVVVLDPLI